MKVHNFSGGPGALAESVLREAQQAVLELPGTGLSVLGLNHRLPQVREMIDEAEANLRELLGIPSEYRILFLQGGGSLQFSMIPMNLLRGRNQTAEYIVTGYWSAKAVAEARREGRVTVVWDGASEDYRRVPDASELNCRPDAAYLHYVSNETVEGVEFPYRPGVSPVPLVCDMSSDFLSHPCSIEGYSLIYAHAQKNLGPAGLTVVVLHERLLERIPMDLHTMLSYETHVKHGSIYNTPPVFAIYVTLLVTRWLRDEIGGLEAMQKINQKKASLLYGVLDEAPDFFEPRAKPMCRSRMNVAFNLRRRDLEEKLVCEAERRGLHGLKGHRSLGGLRASLYNAVTLEDVNALVEFLDGFRQRHSSA
jgi:phosphoserine aminotransferase